MARPDPGLHVTWDEPLSFPGLALPTRPNAQDHYGPGRALTGGGVSVRGEIRRRDGDTSRLGHLRTCISHQLLVRGPH